MICPRTLTALLLAGLLLQGRATAKGIDREKLNAVLGSIVKVEAITAGGNFSLGTAVSVAPGKFVTNCHVTLHAVQVSLLFDGLRWHSESQSSDPAHDICVLNVPALRQVAPVRRRSANQIRVGQDVAAVGFTFGAGLLAQGGTISALHPLDGSAVIQTTTPFNSGASGGGLFDADGALIGILTFRLPGAERFYFSIPADWIDARIDAADSYIPIAPIEGPKPFWAQPRKSLPYFMQATSLEAAGDWQALIRLTDDWAMAETHNAEPWLMRGQAYSHVDRTDAAIKSFRTAVERQPDLALAWFSLGEAYSRRGLHDETADALVHLRVLDPELADDLAVRSGVGTRP
ncbi:MAG: hypothetical protein NVS9B10_24120 [Nevskia sp.]